jgi:hypothetical protein
MVDVDPAEQRFTLTSRTTRGPIIGYAAELLLRHGFSALILEPMPL